MRRWAALLGIMGMLWSLPAKALPANGLYVWQPRQSSALGVEVDLGEGLLQLGYLPEINLPDRLWYGSLRAPIPILAEGAWWPRLRAVAGYHREQTPLGFAFQSVEFGGSLEKRLPMNVTLYLLGTIARSLDGRDTVPLLPHGEAGLGFEAASGFRLFGGYHYTQSPLGLAAGQTGFSSARELSGWVVGMNVELSQLMGF